MDKTEVERLIDERTRSVFFGAFLGAVIGSVGLAVAYAIIAANFGYWPF